MQALAGQGVHVHGQGAAGVEEGEDALAGEVGDLGHGAGGEQQGRHLAHATAEGQNNAAQDAGHRRGQHAAGHRAQPPGTEAEAALAVGIGHRHERLLGGAHDDRQHHDGQSAGAGQQREAPAASRHEEQHAEQAVDDGGNALQRLGGHAHQAHKAAAAAGVLHQVDSRTNAHGHRQRQSQQRHDDRRGERRQKRHVLGGVFPLEQIGSKRGHASHQDVAHHEQQHGGGYRCGEVGEPAQQHRHRAAPTGRAGDAGLQGIFLGEASGHQIDGTQGSQGRRAGDHRGPRATQAQVEAIAHRASPLFRITLSSIVISRMNTNRTTPVAMRASRCRSAA